MLDNTLFHPRSPGTPLQSWIRQSLVNAIVDGKLQAGQRMPATRHLAKSLGVGRNTVTAAYEELVSQGFLDSRERMGFFVGTVDQAPAAECEPHVETGAGIAWQKHLKFAPSQMRHIVKPWDWQEYRYPFVYGQVDRKLFPVDQWRACSRDALGRSAIDYWASDRALEDDPLLVEQLCRHVLPQRGIFARRDEVMITLGSQHGIYLLSQLLLRPGDAVGVEDPGYPDAQNIFEAHRADIRRMTVDDEGMVLDAAAEARLKGAGLVFVTPAHHCPTMVTMTNARRARLLELAEAEDFLILEDDYEGEIRSAQTPPALKSIDRSGRVVYIGTMSKVLAPGVRIGYIVAPAPLIAEARAMRRLMHRSAPLNNQRTAAILLAHGHYEGMVRVVREALAQRWQVAVDAVRRELPEFRLSPSIGGSSLWLECPGDLNADALIDAAARRGVLVERGDPFVAPDLAGRYFRLGLNAIDTRLIGPGIAEIAAAAREVRCY
ncbi:PLP-dependent aminotransferase family protein [Pseudooceanicola sp. LIPI14-2-Ac024]|uniref:MocR-like pyridoxine biosynthesis transcription factor PdxR n=1 Tax=Pseudooceanicola sp. LIPI14-2-Ac024 TaxID=3344875 RepID=UPI0035CFF504